MIVVHTFADARRAARGSVGLVPTMGFFHEGHLSLMERARDEHDTVTVSLFVNPLQFNEASDLEAYPRNPDRDAALAEAAGVDVLFAPPVSEMYPVEPLTRVVVTGVTARMEGSSRPGHFEGVATVVAKLFAGLGPDAAYFGRKDAQQLAVVRRLVADLSFPLRVVGCPIVRERDGLALSSRNVLLGAADRERALGLSRGLAAAVALVESGARDGTVLEQAVGRASPDVSFEYVELVAADTADRLERLDRNSFLAVAARVGPVRLIDNVAFEPGEGGVVVVEPGRRLDGPSLLYGGL